MTILVFGENGQVATEIKTMADVVTMGRSSCDIEDNIACYNEILKFSPSAVINAAAYTAVDRAESEECLATKINGFAPYYMALACRKLDIPFVHISTDYVFDGSKASAYQVNDAVRPLNAYARSKLVGEWGVGSVGGRAVILRTSWVFSVHGNNFPKTILKLAKKNSELSIVSDQYGGPTPAKDIGAACIKIINALSIDHNKAGTYHLTGAPDISWYQFAQDILRKSKSAVTLRPVTTSEYNSPAVRPLNSRLDCRLIEDVFGIPRPDWKSSISEIITTLDGK